MNITTQTNNKQPPYIPANLKVQELRQRLIDEVEKHKAPFQRALDNLRQFDDTLRTAGQSVPFNRPTTNGHSTTASANTKTAKGSHAGKTTVKAPSKTKTAAKTKSGPAKAKTSSKVKAKTTAKATRRGRKPNDGMTLKEAMCKVIGKRTVRAAEVFAGLKEIGHVPNAQNPEKHVGYMLSSEPEIFPRVPEKGRGWYRADPTKLPKGRGGRQPGSKTARTAEKEAGSSSEPATTTSEAPSNTNEPIEASSEEAPVSEPDAGEQVIAKLGYDPLSQNPMFPDKS